MILKKIWITVLFAVAFAGNISAQQTIYKDDTSAIYILTRMSTTLQNLSSCKFTAHLYYDVLSHDLGLVKHASIERIWIQFPDKFLIHMEGDKGKNALLCDGKNFYNYSYMLNRYAETKASSSVIGTMDSAHNAFGIDFPAADFFYPSFVSDILETGGTILNLGLTKVFDTECFHIAGKDANGTSFQFWIANDEYLLPVKMVITYPQASNNIQYEVYYNDWELNSSFPPSMFNFMPPPRALKMEFLKSINSK